MSRGDDVVEYLLSRGMYAEQVKDLAASRGLSTAGTKDEVVGRILASGRMRPVEVLAYVDVPSLKNCCEEFGLDTSGTRDILVDRISAFVQRSWGASKRRLQKKRVNSGEDAGPRQVPVHVTISHEEGGRGYSAVLSIIGVVAAALGIYFYGSFGLLGLVLATVIAIVLFVAAYRLYPKQSD